MAFVGFFGVIALAASIIFIAILEYKNKHKVAWNLGLDLTVGHKYLKLCADLCWFFLLLVMKK